jgi:serine/threonine protein kinase
MMDKNFGCPPASELAELLQGKIVEPDLSKYSSHLEDCSACQETARTLTPYDTLVESLRGEATAADQIARDVPRLLIERLKQIPSSDSRIGLDVFGQEHAAEPPSNKQGFLAPALEDDELGRLGHYRVLKVLGHGGMGAVFLAEDPKLGRHVALKAMLPRIAANPTAKDRFLREARAAARLKNDHVVTIYHVDEANGVPFVAMELLEGHSLDHFLRAKQPLETAQVLHIARDIAKGLAAAHEKGLVHRDIKPGNLWLEGALDSGFRIKILDFGLALAARDNSHITQSGDIVGTPAFMAPEQARGDKAVDARADLFSLGCVLYQLCTGDTPFKAETAVGTLMAVVMNDPVAPDKLNRLVPVELSQLIMQLMEKNPERRPQSAKEVIDRLIEIERSLAGSGAAFTTSALATRGTGANSTVHSYQAMASSKPSRKRGASLALVGLSFAALALFAGTILFWQLPDGRVVRIETDDPSMKLAFNKGELKVVGAYKEPITLKPGKVDLKIVKPGDNGDDFEFETDKLVVHKRDKIVLKIEMVDGRVQIVQAGKGVLDSKLLPVKSDPDRAAAEWVLSIGGRIQLNGVDPWFEDATNLPQGQFRVSQIALAHNSAVTDAGLSHCKGLKELTYLNLDDTQVSDAGLAHFKELTALVTLNLWGTKVTDAGLVHIQHLPALRELGLGGRTQVTTGGVLRLKSLKNLTHLYLDGSKVTDAVLPHLKDFEHLTVLDLGATMVTDNGLSYVTSVKGLTTLSLHTTATTDATLERLKSVPAMTILNVDRTKVTDVGLRHLHALKELQLLYIRDTQVTRAALKEFHSAVPSCRIEHDGEPL